MKRRGEASSDKLLSVLVHGPNTQWCIRLKASEALGEQPHLYHGLPMETRLALGQFTPEAAVGQEQSCQGSIGFQAHTL